MTTPLRTPTLSDDRIMRVITGLRPCRRGGLRIEPEFFQQEDQRITVVHNYGQGGCGLTIGFGCAQLAADLVQRALREAAEHAPSLAMSGTPSARSSDQPGSIVVLGAGVIGLTTARELCQRGFDVTIIAEHWDVDTTSGIAGGLWLPTGVEFGTSPEQVARIHDILHRSRAVFESIDRDRYRVERLPVYEPAGSPYEPQFFDNGTVDPPRPLDRLPVGSTEQPGQVFFTDFIHTLGFLRALREDVELAGARFVQRRLTSVAELFNLESAVIVNCLGLGARALFGDDRVYPARGMLVLMQPEPLGYIVHDGYRYLFPREDALILGGCFDPDVWDQEPDERIAAEILKHHRAFFA